MLIILLGGIITIALTQNAEAGSIITTRSNIKSGKAPMDVKGNNNQLSTQDVIINQYNNIENNCGEGAECSNSATFEIGDISTGGQTNDFLASVGDSNEGVGIGHTD
jgi:hypothetical protein